MTNDSRFRRADFTPKVADAPDLAQTIALLEKITGLNVTHAGSVKNETGGFELFLPTSRSQSAFAVAIDGEKARVSTFENPLMFKGSLADALAGRGILIDRPFYDGPQEISDCIDITATLVIRSHTQFKELLGVSDYGQMTEANLLNALELHETLENLGLAAFQCCWDVSGDTMDVTVHADVADWSKLVSETREQVSEHVNGLGWFPSSPEELLYQVAIGSNARQACYDDGYVVEKWGPFTRPEGLDMTPEDDAPAP